MVTLDNVIERLKYDREIDMDINELAPQIAECLEELKAYREIGTVEECKSSVLDIQKAYNKGVDDLAECIQKEVLSEERWLRAGESSNAETDIAFSNIREGINLIAEELMEGCAKNFAYDAHAIAAEMEGGSLLDCEEAQDAGVGSACAAVEQAEYEMDMER